MSTAAERAGEALQRRKSEDFRFFLLAHSNCHLYQAGTLDECAKHPGMGKT